MGYEDVHFKITGRLATFNNGMHEESGREDLKIGTADIS